MRIKHAYPSVVHGLKYLHRAGRIVGCLPPELIIIDDRLNDLLLLFGNQAERKADIVVFRAQVPLAVDNPHG